MKSNLISGIASWKSAALLAVVAMVAAVAFSGVLSTTQTASAEVQMRNADGTFAALTGNANNGDTVYVQHDTTDGYVQFEISTIGASASFTHSSATNNGQTIVCNAASAAGACDVDTSDTGVTVAVKIDSDSAKGVVFVKQTRLTGSGGDAELTEAITVDVAPVPTKLTLTPAATAINSGAGAATAGSTTIDIRLTDENARGIAASTVTIVSSRALLSPVESGVNDTKTYGADDAITFTNFSGTNVLAGTVVTSTDPDGATPDTTDSAGYARVVLTGGGSAGISTVTVTVGEISASVDIVLHGPVAAIEAAAEQSAIEVGGKTFIVVTATDAAGNPVKNQLVSTLAQGGIVPPERLATAVQVLNTVNKQVGPADGALVAAIGELPSCGAKDPVEEDENTEEVEARPASTGTNDAGKCVLEVEALGGSTPSPADDSARGTHTITLVASGTGAPAQGVDAAVVEIEVGGAPASIETDAPERINPSDEVAVNITVLDDEGVRVGGVTIEVLHTAGDGAIIADAKDKTVDGRASFTYIAPSTPGVVEFLVRTKAANGAVTSQQPIIIAIGPEPVEAPEAPPATWSQELVSGTHNLVWNGDDGADPADGAGEGVTAIWQWNGSSWDGYFPAAADVPGGNTLDSLSNGAAYWVIVE